MVKARNLARTTVLLPGFELLPDVAGLSPNICRAGNAIAEAAALKHS
jgi:hypothetical protein